MSRAHRNADQRASDLTWAWVVTALAGAALAWTALPEAHWHDTGEFGAVARRLSLAHPPGHPAHTQLTHGIMQLPFAGGGFRANLGSVLPLAGAMGWFSLILRHISPSAPRWLTAVVALVPLSLPTLWLQGVRAEVYALQLLLTVIMVERVAAAHLRSSMDSRVVVELSMLLGIAGANHTLLALCMLPLALWAVVPAVKRHPRVILPAEIAGILSLGLYAHLVIRARAGGVVGWGAPDTLDRFWRVISGHAWRTSSLTEIESPEPLDQVFHLFSWWLDQVGPIGGGVILLCIAGAALMLLRDRGRWWVIGGAMAVSLPVLYTKFTYAFDRLNPDIGGYLAPAVLAGWAVAWLACDTLSSATRRVSWAVLPALAVIWLPQVDTHHHMGARSATLLARARLEPLPPDSIIAYSDYSAWFLDGWARAIEGRRPDVAPLFRGRMHTPWSRERVAAAYPEVAPLVEDFPQRAVEAGWFVAIESGVKIDEMSIPPAAWGITLSAGGPPVSLEAMVKAHAVLGAPPADLDGRRMWALSHGQSALAELPWIARGAPQARARARWHLKQALKIAPKDQWLLELAAGIEDRNGLDEDRRR
ncbi:MAG: protein O-mannosyl-transferase family [Bradymonadia bacterium]